MAMALGTRKLVGLLVSTIACVALGALGMFRSAGDLMGVAGVMAPVATLYGIFVTGSWAEWRERRLDASTIAEQIAAEKKP